MKKFLFILLGCLSLNAYGNGCPGQFDPASGICRFQGNNGQLVQYNIAPPQSGSTATPTKKIIETTIVHRASKYGAIALNKKTGVVSGVLNMNSEIEAKRAAIKQCKRSGQNSSCQSLGVVRNGCIAVASGKNDKRWSLYKAAEKPGLAEKIAINQCKAAGATSCKIIMPEGCSIPDGMYN
ncbi:DUF4189 domain-containing protein [Neisseria sp.]|uniref:DUF4189 domain-containing protein n=1 Tax=Neisseria sp. TaxID=192066 RepID=UPI0035A1200B